jgi:hypothetical protein
LLWKKLARRIANAAKLSLPCGRGECLLVGVKVTVQYPRSARIIDWQILFAANQHSRRNAKPAEHGTAS